ncbi:MAG TPA: BatA domain-containing protein, partial [bacterium]|nr:BatA domain-containing protein [bacterium]
MLRFAHPYLLHLLWLIPLALLFYFLAFRAKSRALQRFGSSELMKKLAANASPTRQILKAALIILALLFALLALARPQIGTRIEEVKREGID